MKVPRSAFIFLALLLNNHGVAAVLRGRALPAQNKIDICHVTDPATGDGVVRTIQEKNWPKHEAHGDGKLGDGTVTVNADGTCHVCTAPDAVDDAVTTPVDTPINIDVLANDCYIEPVVVSVQVSPQNGFLGPVDVGTVPYTPNAGFIGTDSFTYSICDTATGQCSGTATVTITVGP